MKIKCFCVASLSLLFAAPSVLVACSKQKELSPSTKPDVNSKSPWVKRTNTKPEEVKQFSSEHNKNLHFNYPFYDGELVTLKADGTPSNNKPGPGIPSGSNTYAKEGIIKTDKHAKLAKRVFSVGFHNGTEKTGTAWILDYKLTSDNSYPLTWYFGTNAHVLDDLKIPNDKFYPEKFGRWNEKKNLYRDQNTKAISLWKLTNPRKDFNYKDSYSNSEWKETRINFFDKTKEDKTGKLSQGYYYENDLSKIPVKSIFTGNDFLTTSPEEDSINNFPAKEDYADFAVFELTFENENQAKEATNDYANWKEEDKFKYHKEDLIANPSLETEQVYTVGYPRVDEFSRTLATNLNAIQFRNGEENQNNGLSTSQHYNTWNQKPGKFDGHIGMPWFGYNYEWVDNNDYSDDAKRSTKYATYGLIYGTNSGNMRGGSSGALVVDENGYSLGIHFGSDNNASTGLAQAFYSNGFDYKGYYGKYNLPKYDLIRGGYPKQKKSYYDGMVDWYGKDSNFKTHLFPKGLKFRN